MLPLPKSVYALLQIASFAVFASAEKLAFKQPDLSLVTGNSLPYYTVGENVNISWTTPFKHTTLIVYQQREDGTFVAYILASTFRLASCQTELMHCQG